MTTNKDNDVIPEDSMSPPEVEISEEKTISLSTNYSGNDIERALAQLVNLSDENIIHEPTCMVCSHAYRKELEEKWTDTKSCRDIKKISKDKTGIALSSDIIENHMRYHLSNGIKEIQKVEYINRIKRLNSVELTTLDSLNLCFAALIERLTGINSITAGNDLSQAEVERIKSAETTRIMGSFNNLLKLKASIMGEMKNSGELITIPRNAFVEIFDQSIIEAENDGQKAAIRGILAKLTDIDKVMQ